MRGFICVILLFLLFSGCLQRNPRKTYPACYGVEHNPVRDSLGIVLLDSSWVPLHTWDGATVWGPEEEPPFPRHSSKQVNYNNDSLYCEIDVYGNGETYQTVDGPSGVSLEVVYYYRSARSGPLAGIAFNADTVGWICVFNDSPGGSMISKARADSIIESWGIKN